jgi:hypothetical protein
MKSYVQYTYGQSHTRRGKQEAFSLKLNMRLGCPLLLYIVLEFVAIAIMKKKERKGIELGKGEDKLFLFAGMILCLKDPKWAGRVAQGVECLPS